MGLTAGNDGSMGRNVGETLPYMEMKGCPVSA